MARILQTTFSNEMAWIDLIRWGRDKMGAIFQTTFSNGFFLNEITWISIKISSKFVPSDPINNVPALVKKTIIG